MNIAVTELVRDCPANCPYFQEGCDAVGKAGISALVKSISVPGSNGVKRIRYKQTHEAARKEWNSICVLKKKWLSREKAELTMTLRCPLRSPLRFD
ncbi:hypothetical protein Tco_0719275 [Tanacetum coccineum]